MLTLLAQLLVPLACVNSLARVPLPIWHGHVVGSETDKPAVSYLTKDLLSLVLVDSTSRSHFVTLNKRIEADLTVRIARRSDLERPYAYSFSVSNRQSSKDPVAQFTVLVPENIDTDGNDAKCMILQDSNWIGFLGKPFAEQCEMNSTGHWRYLVWVSSDDDKRIQPGSIFSGPCLDTSFLPGFTTGYFGGPPPRIEESFLTDDSDTTITTNLPFLQVHLPVIGPVFPPGTKCAAVIDNYREGIDRPLLRKPSNEVTRSLLHIRQLLDGESTCPSVLSRLQESPYKLDNSAQQISASLRFALTNLKPSNETQNRGVSDSK